MKKNEKFIQEDIYKYIKKKYKGDIKTGLRETLIVIYYLILHTEGEKSLIKFNNIIIKQIKQYGLKG